MNRILSKNPNTVAYWTKVYQKNEYDLGCDLIKHTFIASQIIDESLVVDYGCGPSELIEMINRIRPNCKLIGVDHVIDKPLYKDNIKYITSDIYTPATDSADYVLSTEVMEHVDDPQKLVDCLYDSLKTEGTAILTTPYLGLIPSSEHIWEFNYNDMYKLFSKFTKVWVMPYASGRQANFPDGSYSPSGNNDTILVKALK